MSPKQKISILNKRRKKSAKRDTKKAGEKSLLMRGKESNRDADGTTAHDDTRRNLHCHRTLSF
jgi:hypothetical protein